METEADSTKAFLKQKEEYIKSLMEFNIQKREIIELMNYSIKDQKPSIYKLVNRDLVNDYFNISITSNFGIFR